MEEGSKNKARIYSRGGNKAVEEGARWGGQ